MLRQKETDQVQLPEPLLPKVSNRSDYEPYQPDTNRWFQAMGVICQRHGLPTDKLTRFGDGTDAAFGTNIVFAVGTDLVIKLYPPYYARLFDADRAVADYLYSKLNITTPEIVAHGTFEELAQVIYPVT